ncbi:MAG: hypothetical protein ABMA01_17985 [Chthoniobacteraceae bacterium]
MRLFAICCYAVALFYAWTGVDTMRTGIARPLSGRAPVEQRRDDPASRYQRILMARWLMAAGFAALGAVMQFSAGKFDALNSDERK